MAINLTITYVLPVILLFWLWWWPMQNALGLALQVLSTLSLTLAIASVRAWIPAPKGWVAILVILAMAFTIRTARKWPARKIPETA